MTSSDLDFFFDLEELFNEYTASGQVLKLTKDQRNRIKNSKLDYEVFKYDFNLVCRFIAFFSFLERKIYSKTHVTLMKYVFIFSSFLKNRATLEVSFKNEILLSKAIQILTSALRTSLSALSSYNIKTEFYDAGKIFISYALVNIHEISGITKMTPINSAAFSFISYEVDLQICEPTLIIIASKFNDYDQISKSLDETVESKAFAKYSKQPRPVYKDSIEKRILLIFGIIALVSLITLIVLTEIILSKF